MLGAIAGFAGGFVDDVVMRIVDVMLSFPAFILALAVTVMLGNRIGYVIAALAFAYTPFFVRLTRGEVLKIRDSEYADAARVVGNPPWRVAFRHVFPNAVAPAVVLGPIVLGWAILDAAALGFLGIGIRPPTSRVGRDGRRRARRTSTRASGGRGCSRAWRSSSSCSRSTGSATACATSSGRHERRCPILTVDGLTVSFPGLREERRPRASTTSPSRSAARETVALVGESGSGKSVTALAHHGPRRAAARIDGGRICSTARTCSR